MTRGHRTAPRSDGGLPRRAWAYGLLPVLVFVVYLPSLGNGFVDWDDPSYVVRNPDVAELSAKTVAWAFTTFDNANWHPLTWISHALDRELYGLEPRGHHLTNVLLHAANSGLLLLAFKRLSGRFWPSAAVAALFALHPLRVENVAWVSERKDLLCSFFVLLTLLAYERYVRQPGTARYLVVVLAFVLALLAKPMAVTLPFVLLLLDLWPLERWRWPFPPLSLWIEKVPLLALSAASSIVTYVAQARGQAVQPWEMIGAGERLANAAVAVVTYLGKTLWPAPGMLLPFYTHPHYLPGGQSSGAVALAGLVLVLVTAFAVAGWRRRPYLVVGWLWFLGMLVPVLGLVQVGGQRLADRYTYLPILGPLIALVWLVADLTAGHLRRQHAAVTATVIVTLIFAGLTWQQQSVWRNGVSLWEHTVAGEPMSPIAHLNLANVYHEEGRDEAAFMHYRQAIKLKPDYAPAHAALAVRLGERRQYDEALEHFQIALRLRPDDAYTRGSLGNALLELGQSEAAIAELETAVAAAPKDVVLRNSLAKALLTVGHHDRAIAVYEKTLALAPDSPAAHNNLAIAYLQTGRLSEGTALLREAVRLDPQYRSGHYNLGLALRQAGDTTAAEHHLALARQLE